MDLALIAGFVAVLLLGPGKLSLDYVLGIEKTGAAEANPDVRGREATA